MVYRGGIEMNMKAAFLLLWIAARWGHAVAEEARAAWDRREREVVVIGGESMRKASDG
jgi:hypothetical protein